MTEHGNHTELRTTLHFLSAPPDRSEVDGKFTYSVDDPFAVRMHLLVTAGIGVTWVVGRDLLAAGTERLSGEGDFKVWPSRGPHDRPSLYLRLERPQVRATFVADLTTVRRWLDDTYAMVPSGREDTLLDWDALTESLLPPV
ncbi:SsgA family sporulation/cell division regulator [Streptomyces sp. NPDC005803]|uniref:SsgA family sporulation/cell division regulator n=1 Tax=Streptomyces sp. NPDC005803 TaxID=3154297 RepID=UPI0033EEDF51